MRHIIPHLAVLLAFLIAAFVIWNATPQKPKKPTREELRRRLERAEKNHAERKSIRRLYVQATCEEIRNG